MAPSVRMLVAAAVALLALVVAAARPAQAHVRLFYYPGKMSIRNADTRTSDGHFSVNNVCGGSDNWGQRGFTYVANGQGGVCARLNYNGGHQAQNNMFRALFACNRPNQQTIQNSMNLPFAAGTQPPPEPGGMAVSGNRTNSIWNGYIMCVTLPWQDVTGKNINDDNRKCTLSFADQRNWGGCMDLLLLDSMAQNYSMPPTVSPTDPTFFSTPVYIPQAVSTYRVSNCDPASGGKCCLDGYIAVSETGKAAARLRGNSGWGSCFDITTYGWQDYQFTLKPSPFSNNTYQGYFFMYPGFDGLNYWYEPQNMTMTLVVSAAGASVELSNVGLPAPLVADHTFTTYTTLQEGVSMQLVPYPTGTYPEQTPWWIIVAIVGGIVVIYLVGGVILNRIWGEKKCRHPHIHVILVQFGCVRRDRKKVLEEIEFKGFSVHLPNDWFSAIDQATGEPYYFNVVTKEVTWVRPKA